MQKFVLQLSIENARFCLDIFDVKPDFDLNIMAHGQTIIDICNKVLTGVDKVLKEFRPDIVLVHGDTSTTLNGALAAFYNKVPVGHGSWT